MDVRRELLSANKMLRHMLKSDATVVSELTRLDERSMNASNGPPSAALCQRHFSKALQALVRSFLVADCSNLFLKQRKLYMQDFGIVRREQLDRAFVFVYAKCGVTCQLMILICQCSFRYETNLWGLIVFQGQLRSRRHLNIAHPKRFFCKYTEHLPTDPFLL